MRNLEFFRGVPQIPHPELRWREQGVCIPTFYYDVAMIEADFLASTSAVKALLPSRRLIPWRVTPRRCAVSISVLAYRDSDVGAYNEVMIGVPVTVDRQTPLFTGPLRKVPETPWFYVRHLPVTTEVARAAGNELLGTPKIVAEIDLVEQDGWVEGHLHAGGRHVLTLAGRKGTLHASGRERVDLLNVHDDRMLRCEFVMSEHQATTDHMADVRLELGDHPIAQELRALKLGRTIRYLYTPFSQGILTPVVEAFAV